MEPDDKNKIITNSIFAVLVIVPLIIGISLYSRPDASPKPIIVDPVIPAPPVRPPIRQTRFFVSGYAADQNTGEFLKDVTIYSETGQAYIGQNGFFTLPVTASATLLNFSIDGYKPKFFEIGADGPNLAYTQNLGTVSFELDVHNSPKAPVEVHTQLDPQDNISKLFFTDPSTGSEVKLNDDAIISFKQSPDFSKVIYVTKNQSDGSLRVNTIKVTQPQGKTGSIYTQVRPDTKVNLLGWSKDNCCTAWVAEDVNVVSWGTVIEYYDATSNSMGYVLNPLTGSQIYDRVGKVFLSPSGTLLAAEYFYKAGDGKTYNALLMEDLKKGILTGVQQSNEVATITGFFFDNQNRLNYSLFYPGSSQQNMWFRFNPATGATDTYYNKPDYWKNYQ